MFTALCLLLTVAPAAAPPAAKSSPAQIAKLVEQLGDDSFTVREQATKALAAAGEAAESALIKALDSTDPEVRGRAKTILAEFKWGIYSTTPPAIVELIKNYRAAAASERGGAIRKLLAAGAPGCKALVRIARAEEDPLVRKDVFASIASGLHRGVASLLEENNPAAVDALLELALAGDVRTGVFNYTAYYHLTGQLPARITDWEVKAKKAVVPKAEMEVLAYLYRASGDLAKAAHAAKEAELPSLYEAVLYEMADWKTLAGKPDLPELSDMVVWLCYRTAYLRLGGTKRAYEGGIDDLATRGRALESRGHVLPYAKGLFLNGRADLALEVIQKSRSNPKLLFEVYSAQVRIKDAFAVVEAARKAGSRELGVLEIHEAKTLHQLGEKDRALATLKKYAGEIKPGPDAPWYQDLVEAELALGRRDEAFAAAAKVLGVSAESYWAKHLFEKLLDPKGEDGRVFWQLLGLLDNKQTSEQRMNRLRLFLEAKATAKDVEDLLKQASTHLGTLKPGTAGEYWRVLGEACLLMKDPRRAADCFRRANTARAAIRLGDLLAGKKEWAKAAAQYTAAYTLAQKVEARPTDGESLPCLALWLSGHALTQAGRLADGKAQIDRAHLLPLGDGETRFEFVRVLRRRGHKEAARREQEYLRRFGEPLLAEPNSYYTGEGLRAQAIEAAARKDWLRAADGYEQTFLRCLQRNMNFARSAAYATVPAHIYVLRARGLAAKGQLDDAVTEAERARTCQPASVELAMHLVPAFEKAGRKKDAETLYVRIRSNYEEVAKAYPKSSWAHNQMGWLAASCRRDLDEGVRHARKAVELSPDTAGYHDTLAEVLFQAGKKAEAIAAQKKALALQPTRDYYKKQLKRLEAGDPTAPRPEDED